MQTTDTVQTSAHPPLALTHATAVAAFEQWESEYRANPAGFYTAQEIAALEVAGISEARAICFGAYVRQVQTAETKAGTNYEESTIGAQLTQLAERVACLNPQAGTIGDGMLTSLVADARAILERIDSVVHVYYLQDTAPQAVEGGTA